MKIVDQNKEDNNELVFSYLTLRNLIGFSGLLLPMILAVAPARTTYYYGFEPSISDYFYTDRGDILVVVLCILGAFLITYTGYNWKEQLLTFIAGVCGIGVAFVPTEMNCLECALSVHSENRGVLSFIRGEGWHIGFAAIFFLCLAIMSLVYFTLGKEEDLSSTTKIKSGQKAIRNLVHKICGWVMVACLLILSLYFIFKPQVGRFPIVFVFETIAVFAFGFSWITKGQTLWPDGEHYITRGIKDMFKK